MAEKEIYMRWTRAGVMALLKKLKEIQTTANNIKAWYESFPASDNQTWGIMNRKPEIVAGAGEEVLVQDQATAMSLALLSLDRDELVIDGADENMILEMRRLLGEQRFDELAAKSVATLEMKPQLTDEQKLQRAIEDYEQRKADMAARAAREAEAEGFVEDAELEIPEGWTKGRESSDLDVEPDKTI